jgi:hypothetical protein
VLRLGPFALAKGPLERKKAAILAHGGPQLELGVNKVFRRWTLLLSVVRR